MQTYASTNIGDLEIPCGKFDPKNTRIAYNGTSVTVFSPDGSTRYYSNKIGLGCAFLLEKELLPNGKILKFHYNLGKLTSVESLDPQYAFNNPCSYYDPNGEFLWAFTLPFAYFFGPAIAKACLDALLIGIISWGVYEGTQYAADYMGSRYTLSEDFCYDLISTASDDRHDYMKLNRKTKKHQEKTYPGSPKDLEKNPDWKETTHP